jgi:hypothetical protein
MERIPRYVVGPNRPAAAMLVSTVVMLVAGCVSEYPAGFDPPFECTDAVPQPTSGGTWGPPWEPLMLPDHNEKLDVQSGPPPGDPLDWVLDTTTNTYYRGSTEDEREINGWVHHTLLVIPPLAPITGLASGDLDVELDIPLAAPPTEEQRDLAFVNLALERRAQHDWIPFTKIINYARGSGVVTEYPTMNFYLPEGLDWDTVDDTVVRVFASDKGAVELNGVTYDRTFRFFGPFDRRRATVWLEIPPPGRNTNFFILQTRFESPVSFLLPSSSGGPAGGPGFQGAYLTLDDTQIPVELTAEYEPSTILAGQCADGLDNDSDDYADECDYSCLPHPDYQGTTIEHVAQLEHSKDFGMIGDAVFCTSEADNDVWQTTLMDTAAGAAQMLNWVEAPDATTRVPPIRFVMAGCFMFDNVDTAENCHLMGNCPVGANYPFAGVGHKWGDSYASTPDSYFEKNWEAVDAISKEILDPEDVRPLHMTVTVTEFANEDNLFVGGQAYAGDDRSRRGGAIVLAPDSLAGPATVGMRVAHELGHAIGFAHDDVEMFGYQGFMHETGGGGPFVDWDAPSLVPSGPTTYFTQGEVWTQIAISDGSPRPPGFGYVGCTENPDSCKTGHASLSCVDGGCTQN